MNDLVVTTLIITLSAGFGAFLGATVAQLSEVAAKRWYHDIMTEEWNKHVRRWRKEIKVAITITGVVIGLGYTSDYWYDRLGRQIAREVWSTNSREISEQVARLLPPEMRAAEEALQGAGYEKRNVPNQIPPQVIEEKAKASIVGEKQEQWGADQPREYLGNGEWGSSIREEDLKRVIAYRKTLPGILVEDNVRIYLFEHNDGTVHVIASVLSFPTVTLP